jgi:hypothetical protein
MRKLTSLCVVILTAATLYGTAAAQSELDNVTKLMDSARVAQAPVFAPKAFAKADQKFAEAKQSIDGYLAEAREFVENAFKAANVCQLALKEYLPPRDKARVAKAPSLVPELYMKAEDQFMTATGKVESGDVKGALKEAVKSTPLFTTAELEAIKKDILGQAAALLEKAVTDEGGKYALTTLDRARTAYQKAVDTIAPKPRRKPFDPNMRQDMLRISLSRCGV